MGRFGPYIDYHASTPIDPVVAQAMMSVMTGIRGNPSATDHQYGWSANDTVEEGRAAVASLIGVDPDEIIFTSGATEANNLAILGTVRTSTRNRIVVSAIEHKCVLAAAMHLAANGCHVDIAPVTSDGIVDIEALANLLDGRTALVSVMTVNNETGALQPVERIADLCHASGALFHTDAAQALAGMDFDVTAANADLVSLSAHKAYGPQGVGALVVRRDVRDRLRSIMFGGEQEGGLRPGTPAVALCAGFGVACSILSDRRRSDLIDAARLRDRLLALLRETAPDLTVNGSLRARHPGNLNIRFPGMNAHDLLMSAGGSISASTGSACTSGSPEPSHVLTAMGQDERTAAEAIRIGIGRFTTDAEIDLIATGFREVLRKVLG